MTHVTGERDYAAVQYWVDRPPWTHHSQRVLSVEQEIAMDRETGRRNVHKIISWIGVGWAAWAVAGGLYFLIAGRKFQQDNVWLEFTEHQVNGYTVVGASLMFCGLVSVLGFVSQRLNRFAALLCAAWCLFMAIMLQIATPQFDQGDIDAWLLLICAFSCVMRWALLMLEPYIDNK